ncbi:MAG: EamA family transporter [Chloroflexi bacterium]|nr:EamA family transporter [Chloroflexota bacterium]
MKTKIWVALLAVYLVWGSTYLGIRFAIETIPPFLQAAIRFLISGTFLFAWRRMAGDPVPTRGQWRSAIIVGGLLLVGGNGLISLSETKIPSGVAALLVATIPMFMVLVEALRPGGVRPTLGQVVGLLIGFSGVIVLIGPAEFGGVREFSLISGGIALFAAFLWSLGSIYNRNADLPKSTLLFTGMEMLMGSIGLFIVSGLKGEISQFQIAAVSTRSLLGLLYLITFGSLIGFTSYAWLLRNAPVSLVSTYAYVNPIVAVLLGNLFAQEKLSPRILLAALIIVGSVVLVNLAKKPGPLSIEPEEVV